MDRVNRDSQFEQFFTAGSRNERRLLCHLTPALHHGRFFLGGWVIDEELEEEFSLTDRSDMKYPVLIGRKLLQHRFIVDVARKNLAHKSKIKQKQHKKQL